MNKIAFEDDVLSIQRLKSSFIYFLWSETELLINDGPPSLVGFIDWAGSCWSWFFFGPSTFLCQLGRGVFLCCIFLSRYFSVSFQDNFSSFTYRKKRKKKNDPIQTNSQSLGFLDKHGFQCPLIISLLPYIKYLSILWCSCRKERWERHPERRVPAPNVLPKSYPSSIVHNKRDLIFESTPPSTYSLPHPLLISKEHLSPSSLNLPIITCFHKAPFLTWTSKAICLGGPCSR